jgi:hypothetical protein
MNPLLLCSKTEPEHARVQGSELRSTNMFSVTYVEIVNGLTIERQFVQVTDTRPHPLTT